MADIVGYLSLRVLKCARIIDGMTTCRDRGRVRSEIGNVLLNKTCVMDPEYYPIRKRGGVKALDDVWSKYFVEGCVWSGYLFLDDTSISENFIVSPYRLKSS